MPRSFYEKNPHWCIHTALVADKNIIQFFYVLPLCNAELHKSNAPDHDIKACAFCEFLILKLQESVHAEI